MRSFGRGIRRRVPPMLDGDRRRVELLYSLLLTLPGTPVLDTDQPSVLAHRCDWRGQGVLVLHNLGPEAVRVAVELDDAKPGRPLAEILANRHDDPAEAGRPLALDGYGYRWLRLPPAEPG
jgi:hypothetical protein